MQKNKQQCEIEFCFHLTSTKAKRTTTTKKRRNECMYTIFIQIYIIIKRIKYPNNE